MLDLLRLTTIAAITNPFKDMESDLGKVITDIVGVIFAIIGVVAVFVIIYAGFTLMTSAGDPGKVKKGKDTILWGVVGLIVSILAYAIIQFVLNSIS